MKLSWKKSLLVIASVVGIGCATYYFLSKEATPLIEKNFSEPIIPRDRKNLNSIDWNKKVANLKGRQPSSYGFQAAKIFETYPDVAGRWLKLSCEDTTERINDDEWKEFCT